MSGQKGRSGGHNRKPTVLKELAGTLKPGRVNHEEPDLPALAQAPRCPVHLKGEVRKTWQKVGRLLAKMGVLTEADLHALEAYCVIFARWQDAEANLITYGVMLSDAGKLFPSPYLRVAEDCLKQMRAWMTEFGITPSSRSRVKVEKKAPASLNEGEDWFNDHRN